MVRATRVTNPLSRALGAGIGIGAMAAAFFLIAGPGNAKDQVDTASSAAAVRIAPTH